MKNTILKIAGVKNPEALYKKYATETDFLKANPKFALGGKMNIQAIQKFEFGGNEEIITPTIEANRQTYPKTITYTPQEWHQKNILAGNVMLGKNNDLNTMFKNNIYPQYTLPNDTVPINYSPVVKQLPMPQGFVDKNKGTFNYAAGQQLPKQANGGQMNFQTMQQFANGGVWDDVKEYAGIAAQFSDPLGIGYGEKIRKETDQEGVAFGEKFGDTMASGVQGVTKGALNALPFGNALTGLTDQTNSAINKPEYNADGSLKQLYSGRTKIQKTAGGVGEFVGAVGTGLATGNVKDATSSAMKGFGEFSEGMDTDSSGERKNSNWATASNVSNSLAPLAGMVGGQFNGSGINFNAGSKINANNMQSGFIPKSSTDNMGQTQFRDAKYGGMYNMGRMQYAMGGMNVVEAENDELVTTNTPPRVISGGEVNMVSNNPYGTPDYAISGNNHGEGENGGGVKMEVAESVFKGKLKNPLTGNLFKKDFKKISFQENMFTKKLENGDAYAQNTANLILPVLAKTKEDMEMYQQAILDNKKQAKDLRAGIMPEQSEGKMPMVKYGGMMNYMAMGGIQESDYQTDPAKLPSLLRQQKANDATILGMRSSFGRNADTNNVEDPLVVTFNKAKNYGKELADKIKNHPDNKKIEPFAMGGKLPMYYMGGDNDPEPDQPYTGTNYKDFDEANYFPQGNYNNYDYLHENNTPENHTAQSFIKKFNDNYVAKPLTALQKLNSPIQFSSTTKVDPKINTKGKGFDWANAGKQVGQYALQNAGNIYDLYRSTQDNSKLNLARYSPELLSAEKSFFDNQRTYSEGIRQAAPASGGSAGTYLGNLGALRGQKMDADLNTRVQFGNINAQIANAAKLYNAGVIDKETLRKQMDDATNRNLKGKVFAEMSQNFLNQRNSDRQDALDQQRLGIQKDFYKEYWANQDRENQRKVDEITKGKSNSNLCIGGNCFDNTGSSNQTQSTQSTPSYFNQNQDRWNALAKFQDAQKKMGY